MPYGQHFPVVRASPTGRTLMVSDRLPLRGRKMRLGSAPAGQRIVIEPFAAMQTSRKVSARVWQTFRRARLAVTKARCVFSGAPVLAPRHRFGSLRPC
jgi:hypothetical protein